MVSAASAPLISEHVADAAALAHVHLREGQVDTHVLPPPIAHRGQASQRPDRACPEPPTQHSEMCGSKPGVRGVDPVVEGGTASDVEVVHHQVEAEDRRHVGITDPYDDGAAGPWRSYLHDAHAPTGVDVVIEVEADLST